MARRPTPPQATEPELVVSRAEIERRITTRIEKGQALLEENTQPNQSVPVLLDALTKWHDYNEEMLTRSFTTPKISKEYTFPTSEQMTTRLHEPTQREEVESLRRSARERIGRLESIRERLELIPLASGVPDSTHASAD